MLTLTVEHDVKTKKYGSTVVNKYGNKIRFSFSLMFKGCVYFRVVLVLNLKVLIT